LSAAVALSAVLLLSGAMPNKLMQSLRKASGQAPAAQKPPPEKKAKAEKKTDKKPAEAASAPATDDLPPVEAPAQKPAAPPAEEAEAPAAADPKKPAPQTTVEATSQPVIDAATSVQLRSLEERVNDLKEKIFRSKARLQLLQEAVLHGTITGARAVLVHKNEMSGSFKLEQIQYALDGAPIYNHQDAESDPKGNKDVQSDEFEIFNGSIVPGSHQISVYLVYRGNGYGVFSYLSQYQFKIKSSYTFTAEEGKQTTVKIVGFEKGGLATELKDRPAVRYDVEVSKELRAPKAPPPAPKGK
jgi:hypothetical protein